MSLPLISKEQKNIFVVLGMARSGTSTIARALNALGVDLGNKLVSEDIKWNPKGFWEDEDIVYEINGKVFKTLEFAPYGIHSIEPAKQLSQDLQNIKKFAMETIQNRFAKTNYWGFKDPSTVKILLFWQDIFINLKINDHYVIALRNPLAVAESYRSLTQSDLETGLLLWLMHLFQALENTHGKKRLVVNYEFLLDKPHSQLARIKKYFMLPELATGDPVDFFINEFLNKKFSHFKLTKNEFCTHAARLMVPTCWHLYDLLLKLSSDQITFESKEFTSCWQELKKDIEHFYPIYSYIDVLLKKNYYLERKIQNIQRSIIWKSLYPLIWLDDKMRARRRSKREKKRIPKAYG